MAMRIMLIMLLATSTMTWSDEPDSGLQLDVKRDGHRYTLTASLDTSPTKCEAYRYLTGYEAAKRLPGVVESIAYRESVNEIKADRTGDEHVPFFHVRLHSIMEYREKPFVGIEITQVQGDSKLFQGNWDIEPIRQGSKLRFKGLWEPDTLIPMFIIDHFARGDMVDRFTAIAELAETSEDILQFRCINYFGRLNACLNECPDKADGNRKLLILVKPANTGRSFMHKGRTPWISSQYRYMGSW